METCGNSKFIVFNILLKKLGNKRRNVFDFNNKTNDFSAKILIDVDNWSFGEVIPTHHNFVRLALHSHNRMCVFLCVCVCVYCTYRNWSCNYSKKLLTIKISFSFKPITLVITNHLVRSHWKNLKTNINFFLISTEYFESQYIMSVEIKLALELDWFFSMPLLSSQPTYIFTQWNW